MARRVSALLPLLLPTLLFGCSDGGNGSSAEDASNQKGQDDVGALDGGQSGSEGTSLRYPCFYEQQTIFTMEVTTADGGCFVGKILSFESPPANEAGFALGDSIGGFLSLFYTSEIPAPGDTVVAQYFLVQTATRATFR